MGLGHTSVVQELLSILGSKLDAPYEKRKQEDGEKKGKRRKGDGGKEGISFLELCKIRGPCL